MLRCAVVERERGEMMAEMKKKYKTDEWEREGRSKEWLMRELMDGRAQGVAMTFLGKAMRKRREITQGGNERKRRAVARQSER